MHPTELQSTDRDERLGEAVEEFMALAESGNPPDPDEFLARYPDLGDDLAEALDGLSLVRGLVGEPGKKAGRLERGKRLAGYRIVRELGSGGMGVVYEAVHVDLDRPVALKVLDARATPDSNSRRRFEDEAKLAAGLHHTHIVPVFDVGHVGALYYYAMQRIEGCGLDRVLRTLRRDRVTGAGSSSGRRTRPPSPPLPPEIENLSASLSLSRSRSERLGTKRSPDDEPPLPAFTPPRGSAYFRWVADVGRQAAQALAHAHKRGVIHRDIKPSNVLVDERGTIWVTDFGLARRLADPSLTKTDSLLGTPRYMSPEQTRTGPLDGRADQFSLGATLYELLTLRPPFDGKSAAELVGQINERDPLPPRKVDPRIPRDLETIVLKTLSKRPGDRYATTAELAEDLIRFAQHTPVQARRIGPIGRSLRLMRRHPAVSAVTAVATAVVLATAGIAYDRVVEERDRLAVAQENTKDALAREKQANLAMQDAMRKQMLSEAQLVRISHVPNRRERGLNLLATAASEGEDPVLRAKLRDSAIEFLAMRDIQKRPKMATGRLGSLTFSGVENRLATLDEDGEKVRFWDLAKGTARGRVIDAGPTPGWPAFWGRGGPPPRIATVGPLTAVVWPDNHGLRFLESSTGTKVFDIPLPDHDILALFAATSPKGPRLVTVERDPAERNRREPPRNMVVNLWAPEQPDAPLATLVDTDRDNSASSRGPLIAFSPDGGTIAIGWLRGASVVTLWDARDGRSIGEIDTHSSLTALAIGPSGLLAAASPGAVRLWEPATQAARTTVTPQQGFVRHLCFSPDGSMLAIAGGGTDVELWDPASGSLVAALSTEDQVIGLAFSPDGRSLIAGQSPPPPPPIPPATPAGSTAAAVPAGSPPATPAGSTASGAATVAEKSGSIAVWAIVDPVGLARASGFESPPSSLTFGPNGTLGIAFGGKAPALFWSPDSCPTSAHPASADLQPVCLSFDPATGRLVTGGEDVRIYANGPSEPPTNRFELPDFHFFWRMRASRSKDNQRIYAMAGTPDGRSYAFCRFHELFLWRASDPDTLQQLTLADEPPPDIRPRRDDDRPRRGPGPGRSPGPGPRPGDEMPGPFRTPPPSLRSVAISPDGTRLYLSAWNGEFHPYRIAGEGLEPLAWTAPKVHVRCMALSPDGTTIALGDFAGEVLLLNTATGATVSRLSPPDDPDKGAEPTALTFSPDGRQLAIGSMSGIVRLIALGPQGLPLPNLPAVRLGAQRGEVFSLVYSPDGHRLATSGADQGLSVWNFPVLRAELARRNLDW